MDLDDRITVVTPEGVDVSLTLAGLASRCLAGVVDLTLQLILVILVIVAANALGAAGGVVGVVAFFVIFWGYHVLFETRASGRTPGKRLAGLRVVSEHGGPVDLTTSAIRNILRIIDGLALLYIPTFVLILATQRNQRPGDLAAGTLVIRERRAKAAGPVSASALAPAAGDEETWDVGGVSNAELAAVRRFLARREQLDAAPRQELAERLADGLGAKVAGVPAALPPEEFLERLVRAKALR